MDADRNTTKSTSSWPAGGRSLRWRLGMLVGGAVLGGYAVALVQWPQLLGWTVAVGIGLVGLMCVISAVFAKSPRG